MQPPEHYTTAEVAARLRIKPGSVAKKIERGQLPGIKVGKLWLIPRDAIDRLFEPPASQGT
jgi:excisionase family DNA binding protein